MEKEKQKDVDKWLKELANEEDEEKRKENFKFMSRLKLKMEFKKQSKC